MLKPSNGVRVILAVFVCLTRFWGLGSETGETRVPCPSSEIMASWWERDSVSEFVGDEVFQVPGAMNYVEYGHAVPAKWYYPPLRHFVVYGGIKLFGFNPYGWRLLNALLGSLTVLVLFLIGRDLFNDHRVGLFAALFLAIEPIHIFFSRRTIEEPQYLFFLLLGFLGIIKYLNGGTRWLLPAGICMGLAFAAKWYFVLAYPVLLIFIFRRRRQDGDFALVPLLHVLVCLLLLPLSVYLLSYVLWFGRGFDFSDFIRMQMDAYIELQSLTMDQFDGIWKTAGGFRQWFLRPIMVGVELSARGGWSRYHLIMNNPAVWLLVIPGFCFTACRYWQNRKNHLLLLMVLFLVTYLQYVLSARPVLLYSALSCLPFAYLFTAYFIAALIDKLKDRKIAAQVVFLSYLAWGLYLFPLVISREVYAVLYRPIVFFLNR